jgi:hypothetical protein
VFDRPLAGGGRRRYQIDHSPSQRIARAYSVEGEQHDRGDPGVRRFFAASVAGERFE